MLSPLRLRTAALLFVICPPFFAQTVQSFRTTADLSDALKQQPSVTFSRRAPVAPLVIEVDDTQRFQTMEGFGISMVEGSTWLLHDRIPPAMSQQIMTRLFDPRQGIGLSFVRLPIGSTDLSRDHYSYDDIPAGQQDPSLAHFSTAHDDASVFPIMREALQLNPAITVMATPWSAPAWMKTSGSMTGGSLREDAMSIFAQYLVRSLESFKKNGIPVKYLSVQNEPLHETEDFPGSLMLADQQTLLIGSYLGPDLRRAGLNTEVLAYDHNWDHPEYPIEILSDPAASQFVAGSALHCYGGDPGAQSVIHQKFPDKGIWMTECSGGTWQKENPLAVTTHLLIDSTRNWAKAVALWGVILDNDHNPHAGGCGTCRGLVTVNLKEQPTTVTYTGDFYALAQASKFAHPGAVRINSSSLGRQSLESVAFQNTDGSIVLLVFNNRPDTTEFDITWSGNSFRTSLPAQSLATYIWPRRREPKT
ncbi:glycoside hydrolase family 30 beta sandwich domain-containing protein [Tunturibacter psychrotolerans]|uniref:Glycoside hydrolase family 30 beta sandwich domain-containing protein n=1 Tax=Tunturiibacter psychrotolerans TaxID=3069686 RepID=A0AAU7ZTX5_9BACT